MYRRPAQVGLLYLIGIAILTVYGIEVCPFLERLSPAELAGILTGSFVLSGLVRYPIFRWLGRRAPEPDAPADIQRPWHTLLADLGLWMFAGGLVTGWNALHYDFPIGSGLKVVLGCATLGIFSATYLALEEERKIILCLAREGNREGLRAGRFLSISTKFLVFIGASLAVVTGVILLLIYKDLSFTVEAVSTGRPFEFGWIVREVLFVFGVLLAGSFIVARQYSRNLRLMFDLQLKAFDAVENGRYDTLVPVVSHDEFSLIAGGTNRMIVGLRERERIKRAFGKYMSPTVADAILNSEQETNLGGRQVEVAILFTDLRDFTPFAERCTPQEVVGVLNAYFSSVVEAVHRRGGVLDKFVGDAAMAVFGLGECESPCGAALQTAFDIREGLARLAQWLESRGLPPLRYGIGIHFGAVVAGNIGSEARMEYTVIGDAVNTASRLEGLTKEIPSPVAVSADVYGRLDVGMKEDLAYIGEYALKGKSGKLPVYGLAGRDASTPGGDRRAIVSGG